MSEKSGMFIFSFSLILILLPSFLFSFTEFESKGLIASWLSYSKSEDSYIQLGIRFLPDFSFSYNFSSSKFIEGEISINTFGAFTFQTSEENFKRKIKPYRLNLKYSSSRFEAKVGLQKISFGSASLLRPLMWFDQLDPRDPIQLTDGVYSILFRTFISKKSNLWFWVLYRNKDTKGWEIFPTERKYPELGGRAQIPLGKGEIAFSFHHRRAVLNGDITFENIYLRSPLPEKFTFPEERYAVDGKWDIGVGLWFEAVFTNQRSPNFIYPWQRSFTVGTDYTFPIGNGIHFLTEYFFLELLKKFSQKIYLLIQQNFLPFPSPIPYPFWTAYQQ